MTTDTTTALELLRQVLGKFTDTAVDQITPETALESLQVDSLALAEMLFELEDRIGVSLTEPKEVPRTIGDILVLVEPHLDAIRAKALV